MTLLGFVLCPLHSIHHSSNLCKKENLSEVSQVFTFKWEDSSFPNAGFSLPENQLLVSITRNQARHVTDFSFPGTTYLAKLARFWMTLAMRVSVREVWSSGYSCVRLNRLGDMMAGHRKRRKREALIRRSLMSCLPLFRHCCFQDANTSFSSRGNTLKKNKKNKKRELKFLWQQDAKSGTGDQSHKILICKKTSTVFYLPCFYSLSLG